MKNTNVLYLFSLCVNSGFEKISNETRLRKQRKYILIHKYLLLNPDSHSVRRRKKSTCLWFSRLTKNQESEISLFYRHYTVIAYET